MVGDICYVVSPRNERSQGSNIKASTVDSGLTPSTRRILLPLVIGTMGLVGCGGSRDGLAPVHGFVTLDGKPLTEGFVFVTPVEGKMAKGSIQTDGTFILGTDTDSDGAQIGSHAVSVLPPPPQEGMPLSVTAKIIPRHYTSARTSGLTVTVKPDTDNELPIELSTN